MLSSSRRMPAMMPPKLRDHALEAEGLAGGGAGGRRQGGVHFLDRGAIAYDQIEIPFLRIAVAELVHLRELAPGIDMHDRKRQLAVEGLAGQPDHYVAVLAERPQHAQAGHQGSRLAENVDALAFQPVEMVHGSLPRCNKGARDTPAGAQIKQRFARAGRDPDYQALRRRRTSPMVRNRILKSRRSDQFSM